MTSGHPNVDRRPAKPSTAARRKSQRAEVRRILVRFREHEERLALPRFVDRNLKPEVRREFHEADRLGRGLPL